MHCALGIAISGIGLSSNRHLDRVLRCSARLIESIPKYASATAYMHDTLHWLPVAQLILNSCAGLAAFLVVPQHTYVSYDIRYFYHISGRRASRSSATGQLLDTRATTSTRQHCTFSIVDPFTWNGLSLEMCLLPRNNIHMFYKMLRLICIAVAPLVRFLEGACYELLNE